MKIILAPDSFKGSLTSLQVTSIMKQAIQSLNQDNQIIQKPMADGGEGTVDSLITASKGTRIPINCTGPLGNEISTYYGIIDQNIAVIEIANIAGLTQVDIEQQNPDNTTTYGLGEVITDALNRDCKTLIIGLGGSATNDAGLGMLTALGIEAFDHQGNKSGIYGRDLLRVKSVNSNNLDSRLKDIQIKVAYDVQNPLTGEKGASAIYGPQKGATQKQIFAYDEAMDRFAHLLVHSETSIIKRSGAGAAGGLGFALLTLNAELIPGAQLIGEASHLADAIKQADLILTGEGQSDEQTLFGKAPGYVADLSSKYNVPTILISGGLNDNIEALLTKFSGCFSIIDRPLSLEECMDQAEELLYQQTKQLINLIYNIRKQPKINIQ